MPRYRSGAIRIEVCDVMSEICDDDLLIELEHRKLRPAAVGETADLDIVREAYWALGRNRPAEARSILERILFPKWKSVPKCRDEYEKML